MADLYSVLSGIQVSADEVLEAELLAAQIIQAKFPDLDLREGTGLRDLAIRPGATLLAMINKLVTYYFTQNTLVDVDDTTSTDLVDKILSNWFVTRKQGTNSRINARLYFAAQKNITLTADNYFSTDNILKFFPAAQIGIPATLLTFDAYQNEYYYDVELVAEQSGSGYDISSGSLLYFSNFDPYFLHAEINYLASSSSVSETNTQFIARTRANISTRNLINIPSIVSNIMDNFYTVSTVTSIGYGDIEMLRDQVWGYLPSSAYSLTTLTSTGAVATATLASHGFTTGRSVTITGSAQTEYNGTFTITGTTLNTFTYAFPGSGTSPATGYPKASSATNVLLHIGGKVDVYARVPLANKFVYTQTDNLGKALVNGAVYKFSRVQDDGAGKLPYYTTTAVSSITCTQQSVTSLTNVLNVATCVTPAPHGYIVGQTIFIMGATGLTTAYNGSFVVTNVVDTYTFNYIVPTNTPLTATGTIKTNPATVTATCTTAIPHLYSNGDSIVIMGADQTGYNKTATVAVTGGSTFTYTIPGNQATPATGTITSNKMIPFTASNYYSLIQTLTSLTSSGTEATATLYNHNLTTGRYVIISGASPSGYNGTFQITGTTQSTFTYTLATTLSSPATGTIVATGTDPLNDFGFSDRSIQVADFGPSYPNKLVTLDAEIFQDIDGLQVYLDDQNSRVLCGDYLARGFNFYHLTISIMSYDALIPDPLLCSTIINAYLEGLAPGQTFIMADMVSALNVGGVTTIQTPPVVTYEYYHRDLIPVKTGTITDYLDPLDRTNLFILKSVTTDKTSI